MLGACHRFSRPWIAQVLFVTTGGEAAIWPHHLEVLGIPVQRRGPGISGSWLCSREDHTTSLTSPKLARSCLGLLGAASA